MKIHFIGIGGFGMSGLAEYFLSNGHTVTGSDISDSNLLRRLKENGAIINNYHSAENLSSDTDLVVYTPAISPDNPELIKATELKLKIIKRAELLGAIVNRKKLIAISGTHGKTTTSAMIAYELIKNNFDPTVFIGGSMNFLNDSTYRNGHSEYAVVEADEYDRSFLTLKPDIIVITSIDSDHLDIYKDLEGIKSGFKEFIKNSKKESIIVACGDDENIRDVLSEVKNMKVIFYGFAENNDYRIIRTDCDEFYRFYFLEKKENNNVQEYTREIILKIKGKHNALNCLAACIVCKQIGLGINKFANVIKEFSGVRRRMELKYKNKFEVYDDYAHHPAEIKATFEALKSGFKGKMITIFQPHLYTRTRDFYLEFAESLKENDIIILTDIYPAREEPIENVSSKLIYDILKQRYNCDAYLIKKEELVDFIFSLPLENSKIIFQGAGDITNVCDRFISLLERKNN
ncbi:MAG: UDP-N-acetylmuramate--L-alanine ligase [Ignavibacteria bacterium]|nr:UDP-N-acetylmuramate--L-alanine ligase [Ignavibacteria bacterium]